MKIRGGRFIGRGEHERLNKRAAHMEGKFNRKTVGSIKLNERVKK